LRGIFLLKFIANQSTIIAVKSNYTAKAAIRSTSAERLAAAGFSRRLARPSLSFAFSSRSNLRLDDLWDASLLDRLQPPLTRRRY